MLRTFIGLLGLVGVFALLTTFGCDRATPPKVDAAKAPSTSQEKMAATPVVPEAKESSQPDPKLTEALAKLSPEDQALAEKQKVCPVSGEPLGAMGTPKKIEVKGQAVFICCEGCEEKLKANPDEYLAKLNK